MTPRSIAIAHSSRLYGEAIAAALARYPGILPVMVSTTGAELLQRSTEFVAAAVDSWLEGASTTTAALRRAGKRVAVIGMDANEGLSVPETASIEELAGALHPGSRRMDDRTLTPRENEILQLVARGLAAKQVASHLGISPKTVEQHKSRIFSKLGVPNQTAAVSWALANGLSGSDQWTLSSI